MHTGAWLPVVLVACAVLGCCNCHIQSPHGRKEEHSNVAIVGAGIGGAFTAFNLRQLLNDTVNIHVYVLHIALCTGSSCFEKGWMA